MTLRSLLCLAALLTCAAPCAAQTLTGPPAPPTGPSASVPLNTWPFAAVETMRQEGLTLAYPDANRPGRLPVTRFEFAVAVARILIASVPQPVTTSANLATDVPDRLNRSPLSVSTLIALTSEFSPELKGLGQDVPFTMARLENLQERQRQEVRNGKRVLTPEQLSSPFADVSQTDPARRHEDTLQKAGVVFGDPDGTWSGFPPETRLQMAEDVTRPYARLFQPSALTDRIQKSPQGVPALRSLVREFALELRLLGQDVDAYQSRLAALASTPPPPAARPFSDVPARHWAASSVETLRQNGLMLGYPDGAYTTR